METTAADLMRNMKKIHIVLEAHLNARMAGEDLTAAQANVLFFILAHAGVHSTCIHQQLGISRGTVSGLIKKLREKGYVRFDSCETDDRRKPISVTEKARALQETLNGSITELERLTFRGFTEQDCEAFSRLQEKVLRNLSAVRGGTELEVHPQ